MKGKVLDKSLAGVIVIFISIIVFLSQTYGADMINSGTFNRPKTQDRQIEKMPTRRIERNIVSPSSFTPEMSFGEAIDILRNTTVPPLNIVVLWKDLEQHADIYKDTPIGIDGVSGVPLRTHLNLLLMSLSVESTEKLGYVVKDGVIIISTESSLPKNRRTRVYDISDLVGIPANGAFIPSFGMPFGLGGMMPFGLGGLLGGMMPFSNTGSAGQGQQAYGYFGIR